MELSVYLEDLQRRINPAKEDLLIDQWLSFAGTPAEAESRGSPPGTPAEAESRGSPPDCKLDEGYFAPSRPASPPAIDWPNVNINPCIDDIDLMIYRELKGVSDTLASGGGELLAVRPNYGTGIIPSMYGAEIFMMPDETNTLPCTRPLPGAMTAMKNILDRGTKRYGLNVWGKSVFYRGLAGRVFNFAERWAEVSAPYESVRRYVHIYNPDLQGPFPLADMLWGSDIYTDIFDEPETVHAVITFFTDVIISFLKKYHALCPPFDANHSVEWGLLHPGHVIIRNDAAMNISGDMYREFVMPEDQRIIDTFGGGIHFCGKGDHYIAHISRIKGLSTFNMSQPECNDMETIYRNTIDKGIVIIGLPAPEVKRAVEAGRNLHGRVHCGASLAAWVDKKST